MDKSKTHRRPKKRDDNVLEQAHDVIMRIFEDELNSRRKQKHDKLKDEERGENSLAAWTDVIRRSSERWRERDRERQLQAFWYLTLIDKADFPSRVHYVRQLLECSWLTMNEFLLVLDWYIERQFPVPPPNPLEGAEEPEEG